MPFGRSRSRLLSPKLAMDPVRTQCKCSPECSSSHTIFSRTDEMVSPVKAASAVNGSFPWLLYYLFQYSVVFFPSILDIKFVGRTSRGHTEGRSHRIFHPSSFCGACLNFSREKDSAIPFPRRPLSRILCPNDLIVFHLLDFFIFSFSLFSEKNPVCRNQTHVPTCQKVTRLPLSYRGDRHSRFHDSHSHGKRGSHRGR